MVATFFVGGPWHGREFETEPQAGWLYAPLSLADASDFPSPDSIEAATKRGVRHAYEPRGTDQLGRRRYVYRGYGFPPVAEAADALSQVAGGPTFSSRPLEQG